jgi:fucose permease
MFIAFFGIFVYGLLAALPGSVLPTLERNRYLPNDSAVATFLLINAIGAVLAYLVSGPIIDRLGKKFALLLGAALVIASMGGFALTVTRVQAAAALPLIFACSLALGLGANAIVASRHALVVDVAANWRNAALNLLDICFGLGLAALPLVVQRLPQRGGLGLIFSALAGITVVLFVLVLAPRIPAPMHSEPLTIGKAAELFRNPSFWLLAFALFMYVGAEVSVGKWVVTFMQRDERILASQGLDAARLQEFSRLSPESLSQFFETDPLGYAVAGYALGTLTLFAIALLSGRLVSSLLLAVFRVNSFLLITTGSLLTTVSLIIALTASTAGTVRLGLIAAGFGMGPDLSHLGWSGLGNDTQDCRHGNESGDGYWLRWATVNSTGGRLCFQRGRRRCGQPTRGTGRHNGGVGSDAGSPHPAHPPRTPPLIPCRRCARERTRNRIERKAMVSLFFSN